MSEATTKTILELLQTTTSLFERNQIESARLEAEMLLAHVLKVPRIQLYARYDQPLSEPEIDAFRTLVKRRGRHEPVQYILGKREFWALDFEVQKGVLIPRPDTECLIEEALAFAKRMPVQRFAEVGVGSGAISVSLLTEWKQAQGFASDISPIPLEVAARNAERHKVKDRLSLRAGSALEPLATDGPFELIVSNPPYITAADFETKKPHVRLWEPPEALVSGEDGGDVLRLIIGQLSPQVLSVGGGLLLEIGYTWQAEAMQALLAPRFELVKIRKDYGGDDRVVVATGFRG